MRVRSLKVISALYAIALTAKGATSTSWELSGFTELIKGKLTGLSIDGNGLLRPGPSLRWTAALDQPAVWAITATPDGSIYAATGHTGKVFRVTPDGQSSLVWSAPQSEIFAVCSDARGTVYAASSPNGGLYRLENGQAEEVWRSSEKYIWSLTAAADGSIYIGTGDHGRVYRYNGGGTPALYYETGQANVTALAVGSGSHLYAGTDPNGLLYDVTSQGHAKVLYDSSLPEVRSIVVAPDGTLYVAAMGGAVASRASSAATAQNASPAVVAVTPTVITVTASAEVDAADQAAKAANQASTNNPAAVSSAAGSSGVTEVGGVEKSAIYRIQPNGSIETLRSSKDDNVFALVLDGKSLLFSTDDLGRIYRYADHAISLIAEPGSGETTALLQSGSDIYAAISSSARLVKFGAAASEPALYESQVHDAASVARWGHLQWHGSGSGVIFRTRTGYSARPDATWSNWSEPLINPVGSLIPSPAARYIQFRAEWPKGATTQIDSIVLPYLGQNSAPNLRSITVNSIANTSAGKTNTAASSAASSAYSITVTDTGDAPAASSSNAASQIVTRPQSTQIQISWQADDPDGDKLIYSVYMRSEGETGWQLLRKNLFDNTMLLDPDVLADGRYFFRVVASDSPSNPSGFAQETELVSTPIVIDNTPPTVKVLLATTSEVEIEASDAASTLRVCEYSLDAGVWQPIDSIEGVTDMPTARFRLPLVNLSSGEHLLVFRVYDAAGNAGLAKVILGGTALR